MEERPTFEELEQHQTQASAEVSVFGGVWTYRSFHNRPESVDNLSQILFGEGELLLNPNESGGFVSSTLSFGADYRMTIRGGAVAGTTSSVGRRPATARFQAIGAEGTDAEGWVYEYVGYLIPQWSTGVNQRLAIVGSVIRVVPHSNGQAPAGYVGSFVAVKR